MGGSDGPENLVHLTHKEHFVAHHLLYKIHKNKEMTFAFHRMVYDYRRKHIVSSIEYDKFMREWSFHMSRARKGKIVSEEIRMKISNSIKGSNCVWYGVKGKDNPNYGRIHTEDTKRKIGRAHRGKIVSDESRLKMSLAKKGRSLPEKTKLKMSKVKMGSNNKASKRVSVDGVIYETKKAALLQLNIDRGTLNKRLKSEKYINYIELY